jgi:DUF1365 family protein
MVTTLYETEIRHVRTSPLQHAFHYSAHWWLVDLDDLPGEPSFPASDHLGDPSCSLRANVETFLAANGIAAPAGTITMLANPQAFNPLSVFWCHAADGSLVATIAEVHNTYGERHAYLVQTDGRGLARTDKAFYVSPFNDVSGSYTMSLPEPGETLDIAVTLHRDGEQPFVASVSGRRVTITRRARLAAAVSARLTPLRIKAHGIRLWVRRLPVQNRPTHAPQRGVQ